MAQVTLTFSNALNVSCQVGDTAYYVETTPNGEFQVNNGSIVTIGEIREITPWNGSQSVIICESNLVGTVSGDKFIMFGKNEAVNLSSMLGYYAETKLVCDDTDKAELFSLAVDVFESSK